MTTLAEMTTDGTVEEKVGSKVSAETCDPMLWRKILMARGDEKSAESEVELAKQELSDAKKRLDEASAYLGKLLDESRYPTLFTQKNVDLGGGLKGDVTANFPLPDLSGAAATAATDTDDNAWRAVTLEELGIKGKLAETLAANELTTMGQLAEYVNGGKRLIDIEGIGQGKANKIEEAMAAYWERNPRPAEPPPGEAAIPGGMGDDPIIENAAEANSDAATTPTIVSAAEFSLTEDDIRVAYYPNLQSEIESKAFGRILTGEGRDGPWLLVGHDQYVATVAQVPGADYTLIPVYDPKTTLQADGSPFTGKAIGTDEPHWILGPQDEQIHVRVGKGVMSEKVA